MRVFSEPRFQVDTLKVEIPVNMNFVEGFGDKTVMTQAEAAEAFKAQDAATNIPYIYLSGGVSAQLFMDSLNLQLIMVHIQRYFMWSCNMEGATAALVDAGEQEAKAWLESEGLDNLKALNEVNVKQQHQFYLNEVMM